MLYSRTIMKLLEKLWDGVGIIHFVAIRHAVRVLSKCFLTVTRK